MAVPLYQYVARNQAGEELRGRIEARDETQARNDLFRANLYIVSLQPVRLAHEDVLGTRTLPYAQLTDRFLGAILEAGCWLPLTLGWIAVLLTVAARVPRAESIPLLVTARNWTGPALVLFAPFAIAWLAYVGWSVPQSGYTWAKRLLNMQVVGLDGRPLSPGRAILRVAITPAVAALAAWLAGLLFGPVAFAVGYALVSLLDLLPAGLDDDCRFLHDRLARASVVDVRERRTDPVAKKGRAALVVGGAMVFVALAVGAFLLSRPAADALSREQARRASERHIQAGQAALAQRDWVTAEREFQAARQADPGNRIIETLLADVAQARSQTGSQPQPIAPRPASSGRF